MPASETETDTKTDIPYIVVAHFKRNNIGKLININFKQQTWQ